MPRPQHFWNSFFLFGSFGLLFFLMPFASSNQAQAAIVISATGTPALSGYSLYQNMAYGTYYFSSDTTAPYTFVPGGMSGYMGYHSSQPLDCVQEVIWDVTTGEQWGNGAPTRDCPLI